MKKIVALLLFAVSVTAQAQFTIGVNCGANFLGSTINYPNNHPYDEDKENNYAYLLSPNLLLGYRLGDNLSIGLTGGIVYYCTADSNQVIVESISPYGGADTYGSDEDLAWNLGVYARYDKRIIGHLSLFAHLSVDFGCAYHRNVNRVLKYDYYPDGLHSETYTYGSGVSTALSRVTLTPGISYHFNDHLSADLYLNLLNIAYIHSTVKKDSGEKTTFHQLSYGSQSLMLDRFNYWINTPFDYPFIFRTSLQPTLTFGIVYTF